MKSSEVIHANKEFDEKGWAEEPKHYGDRYGHARQLVVRKERGFDMVVVIYARSGAPVGFHDGKIIYDWQGQSVGQLRGSRVYCMGGHYVGQLKNGVILNKGLNRGSIPAHDNACGAPRGNPAMRNHASQRL